jgi:DNA mismatch endonuclease (patch repair protein)
VSVRAGNRRGKQNRNRPLSLALQNCCRTYVMTRDPVKRHDPLTPDQRSAQMAKVRNKKNRSTEMRVAARLRQLRLRGWRRHMSTLPGRPDFCFMAERVVIFVDGCFWHGCPRCRRNTPHTRREFWINKIKANRNRDRKIKSLLRSQGYAIIRIWEHDVDRDQWVSRLCSLLEHARK